MQGVGRKAVSGTLWTLSTQLLSALVGGLAIIVLARLLGPEEYGLLPLVNSIIVITIILTDLGLSVSTARYIAQSRSKGPAVQKRILVDGFKLLLLTTSLGAGFCAVFAHPLSRLFEEPRLAPLLPVAALLLLGRGMMKFFARTFQGYHDFRRSGLTNNAAETLIGVCSVLPVLFGAGVYGALWGRSAGSLLGLIPAAILMYFFHVRNLPTEKESYYGRLIVYGLPLILTTSSFFIFTQSGILILGFLMDSKSVAYYSLPLSFIIKIQIPAIALGNSVGPILGSLFQEHDEFKTARLYHYGTKYILSLYIPVSIIWAMLAEHIVLLLFGEAYLPAVPIFRIFTILLFGFALYGFVNPVFDFMGKAFFRAAVIFVLALINVLLNFVLIPRWGINGAAWAVQISFLPAVILFFVMGGKLCRCPLKDRLEEMAGLATAGIIMAVVLCLLVSNQNNPIILSLAATFSLAVYMLLLLAFKVVTLKEIRQVFLERRLDFSAYGSNEHF